MLNPMDYRLLRALAAVIREGSFERAAVALHVTPSAVSQRIKLLEMRVGAVLVVRGQPCSATEAGARLCRHAEQLMLLEHELRAGWPALGASADDEAASGWARVRVAVNADSLATWFIPAMAQLSRETRALVDVVIDDQAHTQTWLRSGDVLAAVTTDAAPVQGCRSLPLGALRYAATASPAYAARWFAGGVNASALANAPAITFNRKDQLQAQWIRRVCRRNVETPTHWLPSTQAFVDAGLHGIGWGMNPLALVQPHLDAGRLVDLAPGCRVDVPLHWQCSRLAAPVLLRLTDAVLQEARAVLVRGGAARRAAPRKLG
jgi:LysR family transcriptional regulator, chromosome initiation inhibitor